MRPEIICQIVKSVDGRLHPSRFSGPATGVDGGRLRRHHDEVATRFGADRWLVGRTTMQAMTTPGAPRIGAHPSFPREAFTGDRRGRELAVETDPHGKVRFGKDHVLGDHGVAILGKRVPGARLAELRADGVSYLFAGPGRCDLPRAMSALGNVFGVETILMQGGARTIGLLLEQRLIDEASLLVHPAIDGHTGVPTIFEYPGCADARPAAGQSLRHLATWVLGGGMVWLHHGLNAAPEISR